MSSYVASFAWRVAVASIWLVCAGPGEAASLSSRDAQIIAKALGFLDPAPAGGVVAVIYAQGNAASKADAEGIVALFGGGLASGGGTVIAKLIDAGSLGNGTGYVAIILAAGVEDTASLTARTHGILSITAIDTIVRSGQCVMEVHSEPRVDITVNRAAARAAGIGFTAAFGMLVHEI